MPFTVRNPRLDRLLDRQVVEDFDCSSRLGNRVPVVERNLFEYFSEKRARERILKKQEEEVVGRGERGLRG